MAEIVLVVTKEVNTRIFVENLMCFITGSAKGPNVMQVGYDGHSLIARRIILPDRDNIFLCTTTG